MIDAWPILRSQEMSNYTFFTKWGREYEEIRVSWCLYRDYYKAYEVCYDYARDKTRYPCFAFDTHINHSRPDIYAKWNDDYQI